MENLKNISQLQSNPRLTRFIIGCEHSLVDDHLDPRHSGLGRGQQVDETPPQVVHLHLFGSDGNSQMDGRGSSQLLVFEIVCLTADLDLRRHEG